MQTQTHVCQHCGQLTDHLNIVVTGHQRAEQWCDDCVIRETTGCDYCGHTVPADSLETVYANGIAREYCPDCATRHATLCDCCNELTINDDIYHVYVYGADYQGICTTCLEDYYQCVSCGDYCTEDDITYLDGCYYCPDCASNMYLSGYHHTEGISFLNCGEPTPLYLGIELEMEFGTAENRLKAARQICTADGYAQLYDCKEDGSLSDYGMEVVTQPATPAYHLSGYDKVILDAGTEYDAVSHDSGKCGLHIHIDKGFFNRTDVPSAAWRAGFIMDTIISNNEPYVMRFTRRTYSQLNHWAQMLNMTAAKQTKSLSAKIADYRNAKYTRYQAVNMENSETIELRLFRGTLNPETYFATLEFTAALAYLTRALLPIPEYAATLSWDDLKTELFAALELEGIPTDELASYLKRRGL